MFPLIKLAKKLKDWDALVAELQTADFQFPLIKLAKKLKDHDVYHTRYCWLRIVSIN